jgi:predicted alpha/beta-fold hydrolase
LDASFSPSSLDKYSPPFFLFNAHLETIFPALTRRVNSITYHRERIKTPDQDFLDIDWVKNKSEKLVIISHGLEGNSSRAYMRGMAKAFVDQGYDALAWNYRGCSDEMNAQKRFYHSGATDDLDTVIQYAVDQKTYSEIYLIGFSLGGNITLKYLGEQKPDAIIRKAVAFSVPLNLHTSCEKIQMPANWMYHNRFLKSLKKKIKQKAARMKEIDIARIDRLKTLREFDDAYTAPLHGFKDAVQYYTECSSIRFVKNITIPTLIVNAKNDPFLSGDCYPFELLKDHPFVTFESPERGGHVGFSRLGKNGLYWSEARAIAFINS